MSLFMRRFYHRIFNRNAPVRPRFLAPKGYTGNSLSILSHTQRQLDQHATKMNHKEK